MGPSSRSFKRHVNMLGRITCKKGVQNFNLQKSSVSRRAFCIILRCLLGLDLEPFPKFTARFKLFRSRGTKAARQTAEGPGSAWESFLPWTGATPTWTSRKTPRRTERIRTSRCLTRRLTREWRGSWWMKRGKRRRGLQWTELTIFSSHHSGVIFVTA